MRQEELVQVREIVAEEIAKAPILSRDELRGLVREAVRETLTTLGVDLREPLEVQRDFGWLRDMRTASGSIRAKVGATAIGILVAGMAAALWLGLQSLIHRDS